MRQILSIGLVFLFLTASNSLAVSPVRELLDQNRLQDAIPLCRQFEQLLTRDMDNFLACAWVYFRLDKVDSGNKLLEKFGKQFSGAEYQLLQAYSKIKRKKYDEATRILDSVIAQAKEGSKKKKQASQLSLSAQELKAEIYELTGQPLPAAFAYRQIVGDDKKRARAHWGLAKYYLSEKDIGRATFHFQATAILWPRHVESRYELAQLYLKQKNIDEAGKWLSDCYALDRSNVAVLEQLGVLFEKKGNLKEALKYWQKALDLNKDSAVAREGFNRHITTIIDTLIDRGQFQKAMSQTETALKGAPDKNPFYLRRGIINRNLEKYDKASGDLLAYVNSNPADALALRELGICYLNMKLLDQAGGYFSRAAAQEPENGLNHAWLGYVFEAKGNFIQARDAWRRAQNLLKEPSELEQATRKLARIERRLEKDEKKVLDGEPEE